MTPVEARLIEGFSDGANSRSNGSTIKRREVGSVFFERDGGEKRRIDGKEEFSRISKGEADARMKGKETGGRKPARKDSGEQHLAGADNVASVEAKRNDGWHNKEFARNGRRILYDYISRRQLKII